MIRTTVPTSVRKGAAIVGVAGLLVLAGCSGTADAEDSSTGDTGTSTHHGVQRSVGRRLDRRLHRRHLHGRRLVPDARDGRGSVSVTLTIADGVVTDVEVTGDPKARETEQYQGQFIDGISDEVVGKSLDDLKVEPRRRLLAHQRRIQRGRRVDQGAGRRLRRLPTAMAIWRFDAIGTRWEIETAVDLEGSAKHGSRQRSSASTRSGRGSARTPRSLGSGAKEARSPLRMRARCSTRTGSSPTATAGAVNPLVADSLAALGIRRRRTLSSRAIRSPLPATWSQRLRWTSETVTADRADSARCRCARQGASRRPRQRRARRPAG